MTVTILSSLAIALYILGSAMIIRQLRGNTLDHGKFRRQVQAAGGTALLLHSFALYFTLLTAGGIDIGFFSILSLVAWLAVALLLVVTLQDSVECLGVIVFPFAALALLLRLIYPQQQLLSQALSPGLEFHILTSLLAYSLLAIAAVQAVLLYFQDTQLHNKHPGGFIRALPPLESMEKLLFKHLVLGFLVLSISLASGILYLQDMFAQHIVHKTILSIFAWLVFAVLLLGRWRFGWRGRVAIRWVLSGFLLLMLAYFGSKFVIELLLNR
ncbi:MAG: cytochrome c biogenesis protein CcsA [Gammaproteobacteria bacterium]